MKFEVQNGVVCWNDLMASDIEKAKAFYGGLFGWEFEDSGEEYGHYHNVTKDGSRVAGMMPFVEDMGPADIWSVYFATDDAAASMQKVTDNGGQAVTGPMEVGAMGSMAIAFAPDGSGFGLWQGAEHTGFGEVYVPGTPAWFELSTRDFEKATAFYPAVLGLEIGDMTGPEGSGDDSPANEPAYKTLQVNGEQVAGIMDAAAILPEGVPSNWLIYFLVENIDDAMTKVQELGGSIMRPTDDSPWGRWALVADSNGAPFAIIGA